VVDKAEIGEARSIGGAKGWMREGAGGEGEKDRNEVEVAGGVMGDWSDGVVDRGECGEVIMDGEVYEGKMTIENEQVNLSPWIAKRDLMTYLHRRGATELR